MAETYSLPTNADRTCAECGYSEKGYAASNRFISQPDMAKLAEQAQRCLFLDENPDSQGEECPHFHATKWVKWPAR